MSVGRHFRAKVPKVYLAAMVLTEQVSESFFPVLMKRKFLLDFKIF